MHIGSEAGAVDIYHVGRGSNCGRFLVDMVKSGVSPLFILTLCGHCHHRVEQGLEFRAVLQLQHKH
jgi:hypothetical protein